jgi:pSer/pThr/pTyr-binding forkhead associated (FHA) protein
MFKLVIQDDEGKTTVVPLIRDEITIGRKEGNTIRLTERNVSRRHARILRSNGEVQIEDLGSYNGIRVNNARIAERVSLRISDQVQIGDYKLYLKAEGAEQADDARTMPIERIETATEQMGAVAAPAVTAPLAAQAAPAVPPLAVPPNRAQVAVADTDPAGRPVATAAQVAAMTAPSGFGKLVVLSSNFAGKEFDLTRPQMIIGRTDENDLVINHRSISRNHAKVVRDTDSGRYTISDLQSSNGVRVNGQDYGKVELRRGDTVDLGHVRLRFVEPGEDFVFARDAVIADVPESGGKRGLLVAIVLAVVVLVGVGAFFALKGGGGKDDNTKVENGSQTKIDNNGPGSQVVVTAEADAGVVEEPADAPTGTTAPVKDDVKQTKLECVQYKADKKWNDLVNCAKQLKALGAVDDAKALDETARAEANNERANDQLSDEITNKSLQRAKKALDAIDDNSIYKKPAQGRYDALEKGVVDDFRNKAGRFARAKKCADLEQLAEQAKAQSQAVVDAVKAFKCETAVIAPPPTVDCSSSIVNAGDKKCVKQFCNANPGDAKCAPATPVIKSDCDFEALKAKGMDAINMGNHAAGLKSLEVALKCKPGDGYTIQLAFMAACNSQDAAKAKYYWTKLTPALQNRLESICVRNKIIVRP